MVALLTLAVQSSMEALGSSKSAMPGRYVYDPRQRRHALTRTPQNFPEVQYPSIVGRPILRTEERAGDIVVKDIMCGDEAAAARSMLQISYPVINIRHIGRSWLTLATDGKWYRQEMGRYDAPMGFHIQRETKDQPGGPQNPPYRTTHESFEESRTNVRGHV